MRFPSRPIALIAIAAAALLAAVLFPIQARAAEEAATTLGPRPAAPAPYSLPWQLRPAAAPTVIRSDSTLALYEAPGGGNDGTTTVTMLLASYSFGSFAPMVRLGYVSGSPPTGPSGGALLNPVVGGTYVLKLHPDLRLALFLGLTAPVGMGGGDSPAPGDATSLRAGILARSSMDNAMFAVNDFTVFPGVGLAWVRDGFTVQCEATVLQLTRVRGERVQADKSRTNFTSGVHLGYFVIPQLSLGAELRYQRWLSDPVAVRALPATRDTLTVAGGPRFHFKIADSVWARPGLSYTRGLDDPMNDQGYDMLQLDLPFLF